MPANTSNITETLFSTICARYFLREHSVYHLHCLSPQKHTNTDKTHATLKKKNNTSDVTHIVRQQPSVNRQNVLVPSFFFLRVSAGL